MKFYTRAIPRHATGHWVIAFATHQTNPFVVFNNNKGKQLTMASIVVDEFNNCHINTNILSVTDSISL